MFRAVCIRIYYAVLIATLEAALSLVQDDLLYQHNEGKQISEIQYFHMDTSLFLTYYIHENRTWMSIHANCKCT